MRRLSAVALVTLLGGFAACAAREPPARSPEAPMAAGAVPKAAEESAPPAQLSPNTTAVDESDPVVALAEAELALDRALGGARRAEPQLRADGKGRPVEAPKREALAEGEDACAVACRALASMRRSTDRLCDLTSGPGANPMRCDDARARVLRAEGKVKERCRACPASD